MDNQKIVDNILIPVWKGIPASFKVRYARNIWEQFANQIKSAAYTSSLTRFIETLTRSLNAQILSEDATRCGEFIELADERAVLNALRGETTVLVVMVRVENARRQRSLKTT